MHQFDSENGQLKTTSVGLDAERFQYFVPRNVWFAMELKDRTRAGYAFMGSTVSPGKSCASLLCFLNSLRELGFEFEDFELGKAEELLKTFGKEHESDIRRLCAH